MVLLKSKISDIPKDAVVLTEIEAVKYQLDIIEKWPKTSDVFAIRYGPYILGAAAALNGAYFNNYFRYKFLLGHYGTIASYLPILVIPGMLSTLLHTELVLKNVILMKSGECPICLESRAAAIQVSLGIIFPLFIAPVGCAALASRYTTYHLPYLHEKPREAFNIFSKMFRKIKTKTLYMLIGQAFLGSVITYFEANSVIKISEEVVQYEENMRE